MQPVEPPQRQAGENKEPETPGVHHAHENLRTLGRFGAFSAFRVKGFFARAMRASLRALASSHWDLSAFLGRCGLVG